jgi:hypothetical protein
MRAMVNCSRYQKKYICGLVSIVFSMPDACNGELFSVSEEVHLFLHSSARLSHNTFVYIIHTK